MHISRHPSDISTLLNSIYINVTQSITLSTLFCRVVYFTHINKQKVDISRITSAAFVNIAFNGVNLKPQ